MMKMFNERVLQRGRGTLARWLTPHTADPDQRFSERNVRVIILLGWIALPLLAVSDVGRGADVGSMNWLGIVFVVLTLAVVALRRGMPERASQILWVALLTLPLDPEAVYWSPGTMTLTMLFTLFTLLIVPMNRRALIPIVVNLAVYGVIILIRPGPSPLPADNTFSEPVSALVAVGLAHLCIIVLVYFIRSDQAERDGRLLLVEQERSDILRQFVTNASHDLKTPLTQLKVTTYLLRRTLGDAHQGRVADLEGSLAHLEGTLEDMFEMTRLDSAVDFQLRPVELRGLLTQLAALFEERAAARQQHLRREIEPGSMMVYADADHLQRAIANILENAITYTPEGGVITLSARREAGRAVIAVCDTGEGIAPEELARIFERFYRGDSARNTASGKSGLGLAISKRIVMLHHGTIEAESRVGEGSRFTIRLPM
jgi:signal transduction histidine kinase